MCSRHCFAGTKTLLITLRGDSNYKEAFKNRSLHGSSSAFTIPGSQYARTALGHFRVP